MSLRFIYGRAGSGKSYYCLHDIQTKLSTNHDSPLILLVPEQFTLQAERNLVNTIQTSERLYRAEVLSFRRLAYRVFNEVGGITRQHIHPAGRCMLLYRIMNELKDDLKVFNKAANQQGFVNTLSTSISEFKRYQITPDSLHEMAENTEQNELLKHKLEDISLIYNRFDSLLHETHIDADDDLTLMAKKLKKSQLINDAEIWIDGFSGFTPQEYGVIEQLLIKAHRVNITLCTDYLIDEYQVDTTEVFSPTKKSVKKLMAIAKENSIELDKPIPCKHTSKHRFENSPSLHHLEQYLYTYPHKTYVDETKDIILYTAVNTYTEVENVARDIVRLCREEGLRYKDIAVITRNLQGYEKLIMAVFAEYGIPYFIDRKKEIASHPLISMVLSALEIFKYNWSYESVFRYLKSGLTNIESVDINIIENYVLAAGIRGNKWTKGERWTYRLNVGVGEESLYEQQIVDQVNDIRTRVVIPLINFRSKTKGRTKISEICTALYDFLCDIHVPERIENRIEKFKALGELNLANEYGQIWNILMGVIDQIVEVMGDEKITINRFTEILSVGIQEYQIGLIPPALDQVMIGSVERSKSHEVRALCILGVNDGVFPAVPTEEGILSDKERAILHKKGLELAPDTKTKAFEEQYLIYTTLCNVSDYLRLSYPIADLEGKAMRPSSIITRLKKIFPKLQEQSNIIIEDESDLSNLEQVSVPSPTFNALVSVIRRQAEGTTINPLWHDVYHWYTQRDEWKEKCHIALSGLQYTNHVKHIPTEKIKKLYGSPTYTSVSRMEQYASCPFSYYIKYGLKAKERKIFTLSAPDLGTFMHNILEQFAKRMGTEAIDWETVSREWCEKVIAEIIDEWLAKMKDSIFNSSKRYQYLANRLKRTMTRAVWLIVLHIRQSSFAPLGYEMGFEEKGDYPPITLKLPSGEEIKLVGRIDRVDTMETEEGTYLRIIDYKSGNKAFKLSDVYYGLQIQLITYLDALWENDAQKLRKPILPGGILYFRIDDPIVKGSVGTEEEDIEKEIMKQLKMKGLLLADVKLIREMDRELEGDSLIIPARINKGEVLGSTSSVATDKQFKILQQHVKKLLMKLGEEMLQGNVSISPYKQKKFTSCTYCNYSAICQFDPRLKDNNYRNLQELKDDEVWNRMEK